ncbi:response regulator [bacterium]|nr:MAG: response regulator [bacterium]
MSPDSTSLSQTRVLVVESESETANCLVAILEGFGFDVQLAANAISALSSLDEFEPHVVLLGTYLSDMPGYELTAILRSAPQYSARYRGLGLLFVADRHKIVRHRFSGAPEVPLAQYIFKPLDGDEIKDKIARELGRHYKSD